VIKAERVLPPERIVRIAMQVCDALEGAHALQIVHRDLKPANVMLLAQGRDIVKVLDFGLAKSLAPDQTSTTMTSAGSLLGTPAFMPPELALGQSCDGRADLYSLGCMLYLMGAGRLPFVSESAHELIAMHGTMRAPPMTGVPQALATVIDRLLEKDPNQRFQTAADTREALEASLGQRISTPVVGIAAVSQSSPMSLAAFVSSDTLAVGPAQTLPPPKKRRNILGPVLGVMALIVGGVVAFAVTRDEPVEERPAPPPPPVVAEPPKAEPKPEPPKPEPPKAEPAPKVEAPPPPVVEAPPPEVKTAVKKKPAVKPKPTTKPSTTQPVTSSGSASKPALPF
jgi:eukaryotic-like serine/threonine-protein kinase